MKIVRYGIFCLLMMTAGSCVTARQTEAYYGKIEESAYLRNDRNSMLAQIDIVPFVINHFTERETGDSRRPKAVVINYDGCRADMLTLLSPETSAVFSNAAEGGLYLMYTGGEGDRIQNTRTAPGFTTQFTGEWARGESGHGVFNNGLIKKDEPRTHLVRLAEKGFRTAFHFLWGAYRTIFSSDRKYCRENNLPVEWNRCRPPVEMRDNPDEALFTEVIERISREGKDEVDFLTCIFENTDLAGHHYGFSPESDPYRQALFEIDSYAVRIINAIKNRTTYADEDWLILISTDHGGLRLTHGGQSVYERTVWVSSNKEWE